MKSLAVALLLLSLTSAYAEPPISAAPLTYQVNAGYILRIVPNVRGRNILWSVRGPDPKASVLTLSPIGIDFASPIPGTYTVTLTVDGRVTTATIVNAGGTPFPPPPTPTPPPPGPPPKPAGKLYAVIVEETGEADPSRGAFYSNGDLLAYFRGKGFVLKVADKDLLDPTGRTPTDLVPYFALAQGKQLPYLVIVDATGKILFEGARPATTSEMLALVRKLGG